MKGGSNTFSQEFLKKNEQKIKELVDEGERNTEQRLKQESEAKNRELSESESDSIIEQSLKEVENLSTLQK